MSSSSSATRWSGKLVFFLVAIVVFSVWVLIVHSISLPSFSNLRTEKFHDHSIYHVDQLIKETKVLVQDILKSNVSLSPNLLQELQTMVDKEKVVQTDTASASAAFLAAKTAEAQYKREVAMLKSELAKAQASSASLPVVAHTSSSYQRPPPLDKVEPVESTRFGHRRWLVVGIPTVARPRDEDYLLKTLQSFASQFSTDPADILYDNVLIHVINFQVNSAQHRKHTVFEKARSIYSDPEHPLARYFLFTDLKNSEVLPDPTNNLRDQGTPNKPGYIVRRQTRNIATTVYKSLGMGRYYLFLEDDMELCPHALLAIQYLLHKASNYHPNWLAIRASYGMNGIFMHDQDLHRFLSYLLQHQARRPPDHLVVEYYAGETPEAHSVKGSRANIGFKFNLFDHLGVVSTLRSQKMVGFPRCYEMLTEPTVFAVEAYSPKECPRDDIWPCKVKSVDHRLIDWGRFRV